LNRACTNKAFSTIVAMALNKAPKSHFLAEWKISRKCFIKGLAYCCAEWKDAEVSDELSQLPPQVQERLLRLQQLQQTLQSVLAQKQQVELELSEVGQASSELEKLTDDSVIYKATGSLMIRAERTKMITELAERKDLLNTRAGILTKQEERLRGQLKDLQTKLQQDLNPVSPPTQP
jgi:prefoldin beta subunit